MFEPTTQEVYSWKGDGLGGGCLSSEHCLNPPLKRLIAGRGMGWGGGGGGGLPSEQC